MSEMMEVAYQRQIQDVTRDIRIQTGQFLRTAIEIGRLLFEAKAMVEPGGWSRYIEEELPFSHSWANNYMKLYKEYGSDQTSLFGDSQAFMNLRPTQALELLALPAGEREAFVQENDVADMSTRQLRQAIKDLEDTKKELEETDGALEAETERREALEHELGEAKESAQTALHEAAIAQENQRQAETKLRKLEEQLLAAKKAEKEVQEELRKAKENPDIPESVMEQLRREAEADAAGKAAEEAQRQLSVAKEELQAAIAAREAAENAARDAQDKLAAAQKSEKLSNPDVMSINVLGQQLLSIWNTIQGHRKKAVAADPANAKPIDGFLQKVLDTMRGSMTLPQPPKENDHA